MSDTKFNRRYLLIYTAAFALLGFLIFLPFLTAGKSLVGNGDGQSQYILQLRYMGEWLRETVRGFFHGRWIPRAYDYTIGMGDDINSVVRFHPLDYLSVFVPARYTEQLYAFLILLRLYLAGLSFSLYAFYWKRKGTEVLAGSITWLFCGYVFELGIVHPIYIAPMIVMPLLLLGAEYMMESGRRHSFVLLSVMVYLGFTSNYYFMYINSVALLIYVLIRFFVLYRENRVRAFFSLLIRMVSAYVTGLLLSCVTLLPTLNRYFHSYRSASLSDSGNLLYYEDFRRYFAWAVNLISPLEASGNGTHLNLSVVVLPAMVVLLLAGKGKWKSLKWVLAVLLLFLLLPLGGYIMAVMHTENNRWVYLISLAASMCVVFCSDGLFHPNRLQEKGLIAACLIYDLAVAALSVIYPFSIYHAVAAAELTGFTLILFLVHKKSAQRTGYAILLSATAVSAVLGGYLTFGGSFGNLTRYYADRGTTQSFFSESPYANYAKAVPTEGGTAWKNGFYRVDGIWDRSFEDNASLQLGYPGVQIYNSVLNASQVSYLIDTWNTGLTTMLHIHSLDGRTATEAAAGVGYFQTSNDLGAQVPFGFERQIWTDGTMGIWKNSYPLSFGYTTDQILPSGVLKDLDGIQAEEVMLDAVCLEEEEAKKLIGEGGLSEADTARAISGILYEEVPLPEGEAGIERTENGYRIRKKKKELQIPFRRKAGYDVLAGFYGLKPDGFGAAMKVKASGISKKITLLSEKQTYTLGREDYLAALGYSETEAADVLRIRFTEKGNYDLDRIMLIYVPRADYPGRIAALNEASLENVVFEQDCVTGSIHLDQPRFMVFQLPWSDGWSAVVNGERAELLRANEWFLGLPLGAGDSEIRLVYRTPWGREGWFASFAGLFLLAAGLLLRRRARSRGIASSAEVSDRL